MLQLIYNESQDQFLVIFGP